MTKQRASDTVYARGAMMPIHPDESGTSVSPAAADLFLDTDGRYRWYEQGNPTEAEGESLRTAVESARLKWPQFQIIEMEGHAVSTETQTEIPERYAADDLQKQGESVAGN